VVRDAEPRVGHAHRRVRALGRAGLDVGPRHIALDTGCVWGKSLTAFRLDDRMVFQAKSVEAAS
jgi:hypothetical protein